MKNPTYLGMNESPYQPHTTVVNAAQRACSDANRYPDFDGHTLRAAIAKHWGVTQEWVVVSGGSSNVIMQTMIASGQREIAFAWPSFDGFRHAAKGLRMPARLTALKQHTADLDDLLRAITTQTSMVIVCNPHPPTGGAVQHDELARFINQVPAHVTILIDEAYIEFVREKGVARSMEFVRAYPNVLMSRTFSKAYAMAGFRVGYAIAQPELATKIAQSGMPYAVPLPAQAAALAALEHETESTAYVDTLLTERDRLAGKLRQLGAEVVAGHGNFVWLPVGKLAQQVSDRLAQHGILVKPFAPHGVRITVGTGVETDLLEQAWIKAKPLEA